MTQFVVYEVSDGRIVRFGECQEAVLDRQPNDGTEAVLEVGLEDPRGKRVNLTTLVLETLQPFSGDVDRTTVAADAVDAVRLTAGQGDHINVRDADGAGLDWFDLGDTFVDLTFDTPGTYVIEVRPRIELPWEVEINAA